MFRGGGENALKTHLRSDRGNSWQSGINKNCHKTCEWYKGQD
jgi:hypothetical protein